LSQSTNTGRLSSASKSQIDGVESRAAANHCPTVYVPIGEILKTPVSSLSRAVVHPAPGESHLPLIPDSHPAKIGFTRINKAGKPSSSLSKNDVALVIFYSQEDI